MKTGIREMLATIVASGLIASALLGSAAAQVAMTNEGLPAASPDSTHIAFVSNRSGVNALHVVRLDGSDEHLVTPFDGDTSLPAWTRDRRRLLYSTGDGEASHLYSIALDERGRTLIATLPGRDPRLSPDGRHILHMAGGWTTTRLMVCDRNGGHAQQVSDGLGPAWNAQWSPDSRRIAFTSRGGPADNLNLYVEDTRGIGKRQVTHFGASDGNAQWPVWSPRGTGSPSK